MHTVPGVLMSCLQVGGAWSSALLLLQVIFEANRDGFLGAMALDDITVTPGGCSAQSHCSFETDDCGFWSSKEHPWIWQTGTGGQGPLTDHTLGTPKGNA